MAQIVKNLPEMQETWVQFLGWEDPLEEGMVSILVILPVEFRGQRSLVGYRPVFQPNQCVKIEGIFIFKMEGKVPSPE